MAKREEVLSDLQSFLDQYPFKKKISILEAGCGSRRRLHFPPGCKFVGIDISEKQLARNNQLDEMVHGDIEEYDFATDSFDVIICWDVLEHLKEPIRALDRFARAICPHGLIILGLPNVLSLSGLITKFTPYWFHVWVYKRILKSEKNVNDDEGPFPTFLRWSISPNAIKHYARSKGLSIALYREYDTLLLSVQEKMPILYYILTILSLLLYLLSIGRLGGIGNGGFVIVLQSPEIGHEENIPGQER